jgi:tetratricopeptide (TPR) repeat protein
MRISFSALNHFMEEKAATDEAYRTLLLQKGKVTLSTGRALSDEALLARLASLGLTVDRDEFLRQTRSYLSAEEMAQAVYRDPGLSVPEEDQDWVWIAFTCLWERWSPDRPSFEMIDDWMQEGYRAAARGDGQAACQLWLKTWRGIWAVVEARQLRTIEEFDDLFRGTNSLFNWVSDFLLELHNAGLKERALHQERLAVLQALLGRFTSESHESGWKNELAETYFFLGMPEQAEQLFRQWLAETPRWGWGWIGWADGYYFFARGREKDPARAEQILKQGLAIPDVEDRQFLLDRLGDLYEETGRSQEAKAVREEIERLERPEPVRPPNPPVGRQSTGGARDEGQRIPVSLSTDWGALPAPRRVGRNDPCPCGSGKKFKVCCMRR